MIWFLPWRDLDHAKQTPWAVYTLMFLNVLAHIVMLMALPIEQEGWFDKFGLVPANWHAYQLLTSCFVHAGWMHLIGNMLFLFLLGDLIEDTLGPAGMLLLYFGGGLAGDWVMLAANAGSTMPSVGASGCISALAGAYAVMFFSHPVPVRVMFLVFPVRTLQVRAFWLLLLWFGADVLHTVTSHGSLGNEGGVNYVAHGIGFGVGFIVGIAAVMHGVMRRYERLGNGHPWFGYWPSTLEYAPRRRSRA